MGVGKGGSRISRWGRRPRTQVLFGENIDVKKEELGPVGGGGQKICM